MPRAKQGGARQGTPGKGYANRTDLTANRDMSKNTAATGGMPPPASHGETMVPPEPPAKYASDSPNLTDPTQRPGEPLTAGLASGPGPGPEALAGYDPRIAETQMMKQKWLPYLRSSVNDPETPESVKVLYRYMLGA